MEDPRTVQTPPPLDGDPPEDIARGESERPQEERADAASQEGEFREKYLRELAEKENMRKRLLREQVEAIRLAGEKSAVDLLPSLDQFESALSYARSMSPEIQNWAVGFDMILAQIKDWLAGQGISPFDSVGEIFTPLKHEAVERIVDNKRPEGTILREFTKGYRGRQRVIRPARVAVCANELTEESAESAEEIAEEIKEPVQEHPPTH